MEISQASSNQSLKLSSTTTSDASNDVHERHPSIETRVCLVGAVTKNEDLKEKLKDLKIPYLISNDGKEYKDEDDPYFETIFILEDFEGELFEELKRSDNRLLGPPVISSIAVTNEPLPYTCRPLYCTCMHGLNLCFTNFKTKDHLAHLVTLCHYMGACIRKDMSAKIDFLVTNSLHGPKFRTAVSLGTPVMKEEWIHRCWAARRRDKLYQATDDEFLTPCKSKPFEGCTLSFLGFSDAEEKDMEEQAKEQGGIVAAVGDTSCTHLIVEEINVKKLPFEPEGRLYIVVQEWFWGSIQIEAKAAESMYIFELVEYPKMLTRSSTTSSLLGTPKWRGSTSNLRTRSRGSTGKSFSRKRSRLREETLAKLAQESENDPSRPPRKRPSTDTSACVPDSMLDMSNNTTIASLKSPNTPDKVASPKPAVTSARYQVAMEFLNTEKNYVGILQTILNLFKKPLDDPNQAGGPILASEDMKAIFSSLPEIEAVHRSMNNDLQCLMAKWNDTSCIGTLVLKYADEFGRCYPSFVNFFEVSVDTISQCEARSARFHAFLKINQAKRECGRQTLAELLINPVQRLPRIILLLQDIKKHTERENSSHPDVASISNALDALKEVMTYINEDKRKTESQRQIFDIVYEVDGCPPTIVSSHRRFVARAELLAIDDNLCSRGDNISLFIFSDCVEIAKRRRGMKANNFKSPNVHARPTANAKSLKHVKLMSLFHIKKVVNINDSDECENAVALYCRTPTDTQDWLYMFKVLFCSEDNSAQPKEDSKRDNKENENETEGDTGKGQLLRILARHRASALCKAVDDNFVCAVNPHELDVNTTDLGSTLGRAVRAAKKSSRKLTRAFSFTRTPKRVVQRAVSNMLSPSQQRPPTGLFRTESATSRDLEHDDTSSVASSLTPSMSVTSLCTPQRDCRGNRLSSTCDDDPMQVEYVQSPMLKTSVSTLTLARPPTAADLSDFPAVPTPPARRRKLGSTIKAATVAFGRTGSFRRRNNTTKYESAV
ncbi:protein ECT2-like isoform X4 [Clavelina lepadiformis]|uniref:protein ECT2-like isoform X4 n=1 Tax=Clavelina lepadiformis TaxID=159417 RepID=UPI004041E165